MSKSDQKASRSKGKEKVEFFIWTDDEVELLLKGSL